MVATIQTLAIKSDVDKGVEIEQMGCLEGGGLVAESLSCTNIKLIKELFSAAMTLDIITNQYTLLAKSFLSLSSHPFHGKTLRMHTHLTPQSDIIFMCCAID